MHSALLSATNRNPNISVQIPNIDEQDVQELFALLENHTIITSLTMESGHPNGYSERVLQSIASGIATNKKIIDLYIENSLTRNKMLYLAPAIILNKTIKFLSIGGNDLGPEDAPSIAEIIRINHSIETLDLSLNKIGSKGMEEISQAIMFNTTLKKLELGRNFIKDEGIFHLAVSLMENNSLEEINLEENEIGSLGISYISETLFRNKTIKSLDLSTNPFGSEGYECLANLLRRNSSLSILKLACNRNISDGDNNFAQSLAVNNGLHFLGLPACLKRGQSAEIANALRINTTLRELDLFNNPIRNDDIISLANALKDNDTITKIDLGFAYIQESGAQEIVNTLQSNNRITYFSINPTVNVHASQGLIAKIENHLQQNNQFLLDSKTALINGQNLTQDQIKTLVAHRYSSRNKYTCEIQDKLEQYEESLFQDSIESAYAIFNAKELDGLETLPTRINEDKKFFSLLASLSRDLIKYIYSFAEERSYDKIIANIYYDALYIYPSLKAQYSTENQSYNLFYTLNSARKLNSEELENLLTSCTKESSEISELSGDLGSITYNEN
ncbi:MAG: hypothetical protein SFT91_01315 [Rickettsiaceae bacterium]|nr:hypothetical protein [Rickettsiaceae bacterium]